MNDAIIHDAPDLSAVLTPDDPWHRNQRAFAAMRPSLLATHRGRYVAVHEGQVLASGDVLIHVALDAYRRVGYVPVYVDLVTDAPPEPARISSPRRQSNWPASRTGTRPRGPFADAPITEAEEALSSGA